MSANNAPITGDEPDRVMIYRLGSIGDTVIALPCLKFLRQRFRSAKISLLTNHPRRGEAPVLSVIGPMGLVDTTIPYTVGERDPLALWRLADRIRHEAPDLVVYLSANRGTVKMLRDTLFFRFAGASKILGMPSTSSLRRPRETGPDGEVESEAARLARCLAPLGTVDLHNPASWSLDFTPEETRFAQEKLDGPFRGIRFVAAAVGAKIRAKDWGEPAWATVLGELTQRLGGQGLVMIGGPDDQDRSQRLAAIWDGPCLNLCGEASPRQSAAVMAKASVFIGTDGGPMHLAAAAGTACCALFGPYNQPRQWHPLGQGHQIFHVADLATVDPKAFADAAAGLGRTVSL
ncbi:MAG: glycosyltransferase family 9 protein [Proteobacteria bacterium]|nr:glycosyltransferase family 9 protein [Pseudomonadota bacterium]MDA1309142.1 glycosyltransferase family 9 protein [Pseudomonadota bacterium]